jgi:hypothetical protein
MTSNRTDNPNDPRQHPAAQHRQLGHSNLHLDIHRITDANAQFHTYQRTNRDNVNAVCGTFPENKPTTTLRNTPEYNCMNVALPQMAYSCYRDRGGTQPFGDHLDDFLYISSNHYNMFAGTPYRHYFHANVSRTYNSLGDATIIFNRNLQA